jgi:hypothetical protein
MSLPHPGNALLTVESTSRVAILFALFTVTSSVRVFADSAVAVLTLTPSFIDFRQQPQRSKKCCSLPGDHWRLSTAIKQGHRLVAEPVAASQEGGQWYVRGSE